MEGIAALIFILILIIIFVIAPGMRVVRQFERGVVFTLGKYSGVKGPGLRLIIPYIQTMTRVDVRTTPIDVPKQEVITKDNVTVGVDAIVYFRVLDPSKALLETTNYIYATTNFAQAALRDITGNFELDELLSRARAPCCYYRCRRRESIRKSRRRSRPPLGPHSRRSSDSYSSNSREDFFRPIPKDRRFLAKRY